MNRLLAAWRFREWPWRVPREIRYLGKPTPRDLQAGEELVRAGLLDDNPDYDEVVRKLAVIRRSERASQDFSVDARDTARALAGNSPVTSRSEQAAKATGEATSQDGERSA